MKKIKPRQLFLFILMISSAIVIYFFIYFHSISWSEVKIIHQELLNIKNQHEILAVLLFILIYTIYAFLCLPGIFILSLVAGYVFEQPLSVCYVIFSATIGASLVFLTVRSTSLYRRKNLGSVAMNRLKKNIERHAMSYLLCLRFIPFLPFWLVNLAGALFNVPFLTFVWTTMVGMLPSVVIYTEAGRQLNEIIDLKYEISVMQFLNFERIVILLCLSLFSLSPLFLAPFFKRDQNKSTE